MILNAVQYYSVFFLVSFDLWCRIARTHTYMVRKCKSTVDELKVSQLIQGPRLRRSVGMRRDWSFENLGNAA